MTTAFSCIPPRQWQWQWTCRAGRECVGEGGYRPAARRVDDAGLVGGGWGPTSGRAHTGRALTREVHGMAGRIGWAVSLGDRLAASTPTFYTLYARCTGTFCVKGVHEHVHQRYARECRRRFSSCCAARIPPWRARIPCWSGGEEMVRQTVTRLCAVVGKGVYRSWPRGGT